MAIDNELKSEREASLRLSRLTFWRDDTCQVEHGALMICRSGEAVMDVNFGTWHMSEDSVIILFPHDLVTVTQATDDFCVEVLSYDASLLREASLQMEQTVYSALRSDRCRRDSPVLVDIVNNMFSLLKVYFAQAECTCVPQLVLLQLKAFFLGFNEYIHRNPGCCVDTVGTLRVRALFNEFMALLEKDYALSRDVVYYSDRLNISSKYLCTVVKMMTGHTPKVIIDHYVVLQIKMQLELGVKSVKEIACAFNFTDVSFFCRYFRQHTGTSPQQFRKSK